MSAQNGDTVVQEEALDDEEELALGVGKLKVVRLLTDFIHTYGAVAASLHYYHFHRYWTFKTVG
jgi:hypothetical protein